MKIVKILSRFRCNTSSISVANLHGRYPFRNLAAASCSDGKVEKFVAQTAAARRVPLSSVTDGGEQHWPLANADARGSALANGPGMNSPTCSQNKACSRLQPALTALTVTTPQYWLQPRPAAQRQGDEPSYYLSRVSKRTWEIEFFTMYRLCILEFCVDEEDYRSQSWSMSD